MPRKSKYRYVSLQTDQLGRTYVYFRRNGHRIRLPGPIGGSEFLLAYASALQGSALPAVQREKRTREPLTGIYLLMLDGQIVYVGSSLHMPRRVAEHRMNGRPFDQVFYIRTTADQRDALERLLIWQLDPQQNRQGRRAELSNPGNDVSAPL